jgi:tetratricopeptide (TPR) repeat protein
VTSAAEQARLAAEHARNAGDEGLRSRALGGYVATLIYGPQDAQTISETLEAIEREESGPYLTVRVLFARGELERLAGNFREARRLMRQAIEDELALGMPMTAAIWHWDLAEIELLEGNPTAALELLLQADAMLAAAGEHQYRATVHGWLAKVYERLGDRDAAHAAIALSDELGGEDVLNYAITHAVRARLALADDDHAAAEQLARSAVEHAFRTEFVVDRANAKLELARILTALGRQQEAASEARAALELYRAKGDRPSAAETEALIDQLRDSA